MSPSPVSALPSSAPASCHEAPSSLGAMAQAMRVDVPALPLPGRGATLERWRELAAIAAADVCLVKVMEAHYDAQAILADLDDAQVDDALHAVWAAEPPDARPLFHEDVDGSGTLHGTKAWCSGADIVDMALVTAHRGAERVLVRVDLRQPGVMAMPGGWHAVGMARVHSGRVGFDGVRATRIGAPGAYLSRPGFWHGGAGIAACWFGAAAAIADTLRTHPRVARDPHAAAHLGALDAALGAAAALLRETAAMIDASPAEPHIEAVTRVRSLLDCVATEAIDRVGRALGPAPLCEDAAHARRCADLATFVRQSHAERDWAALGEAAATRESTWRL